MRVWEGFCLSELCVGRYGAYLVYVRCAEFGCVSGVLFTDVVGVVCMVMAAVDWCGSGAGFGGAVSWCRLFEVDVDLCWSSPCSKCRACLC